MNESRNLLNSEDWLRDQFITQRRSRAAIAKQLSVTESMVRHYIEKFKLEKRKLGIKTKLEPTRTGPLALMADKDWMEQQYLIDRKPAQRIAEELGVTYGSVDAWIRRHGFYGKKTYLHTCNETLFDPADPVFCYYAGYVATDGHVDKSTPRVSIRSNDDCSNVLFHRLAEYFEFTGAVRRYGKSYDLTISSPALVAKLSDHFKITPMKTATLEFPDSFDSEDCARMYCRGVADGDGNIKVSGDFRIYCGSESFIDGFIRFLNDLFGWSINKTYVRKIYPGFSLSGRKAYQFLSWIYVEHPLFLLQRKYDRFLSLKPSR